MQLISFSSNYCNAFDAEFKFQIRAVRMRPLRRGAGPQAFLRRKFGVSGVPLIRGGRVAGQRGSFSSRTDMRRPSAIKREADFRAVVGACVGNVLEYFDFSLFGYFADVIGKVFFGTEDEHESLMMSFSVFAIAFVVRPIGGILLGMLGDVAGRVTALRLSIALMAIPTFLLGLLPPYATIGIWAPVGLILIRILQGLSAGGELVGSAVYLVERAEERRKGLASSYVAASMTVGCLLGCAFGALMRNVCSDDELETWGFRVPFLTGIVFAAIGLWLQARIDESTHMHEEFERPSGDEIDGCHEAFQPVEVSFRVNCRVMVETVCMLAWPHSGFYVFFVWLPIFFETLRNGDPDTPELHGVFAISCGMLVLHTVAQIGFGYASIYTGIIPLMKWGTTVVMLGAVPLFITFAYGSELWVIVAFALISVVQASVGSVQYAWAVQRFWRARFTSLGVSYNVASCVFGGTVPLVCTAAVKLSWLRLASPSLWIILLCVITIITLLFVGDTGWVAKRPKEITDNEDLDPEHSLLRHSPEDEIAHERTVHRVYDVKSDRDGKGDRDVKVDREVGAGTASRQSERVTTERVTPATGEDRSPEIDFMGVDICEELGVNGDIGALWDEGANDGANDGPYSVTDTTSLLDEPDSVTRRLV